MRTGRPTNLTPEAQAVIRQVVRDRRELGVIPSNAELCRRFHISPSILRRAIAEVRLDFAAERAAHARELREKAHSAASSQERT